MSLVFIMFTISVNLLVALAVDRYCAVCHPLIHFAYKDSGVRKWIIAVCVTSGIALGSLPGLGWHSESFYACYVLDVLSFGFMILCCAWVTVAITIILTLYVLIYRKIRNHASFASKRIYNFLLTIICCRCDSERCCLHRNQTRVARS